MQRKILSFLLCFLIRHTNGENKIDISGGGVVGLGKDAVFKYETDGEWFMCNYYRYEPLQNRQDNVETEFCSFITRDGEVSKLKCDPKSLGDHLEYSGTSSTECTITVKNITMKDDVSWAVRLASDLNPIKFDVTVAVPMESISIDAPNTFVAGQPTNISCVTVGGSPKPQLSFSVLPPLDTPIQPNSIVETFDETLQQRRFTATITPSVKDNGKEIHCVGQQFDKSETPKVLFGKSSAQPVSMDITFTPQPIGNEPFKANIGEKVLVGIELLSNPMPDSIQWKKEVSSGMSEDGNDANRTDTAIVLENGDKYLIGDLVDLGDQRYRADLTIYSVTEDDVKASYHLIVENSVGSLSYDFTLTTSGLPKVVSSNLTMFVLIAVGCIIILVAIAVAVYKKLTASGSETTPLMN